MRKRRILLFIPFIAMCYFVFPMVESAKDSVEQAEGDYTGITGLLDLMPFIYCIAVLLGIVQLIIGRDSPIEARPPFEWEKYGERLKRAYAANFGGDNPGFNEEVDARIKLMIEADHGYRRQLAKNWLKRVSKFVGVDWLQLEANNQVRG